MNLCKAMKHIALDAARIRLHPIAHFVQWLAEMYEPLKHAARAFVWWSTDMVTSFKPQLALERAEHLVGCQPGCRIPAYCGAESNCASLQLPVLGSVACQQLHTFDSYGGL